jgi:hypothetical protein
MFILDHDFFPFLISDPGPRIQDLGSRFSDPGYEILDLGSWIPDLGSQILEQTTRKKRGGGEKIC